MEYFYLGLWFLVPFALQMILLDLSRDRMQPLRFVLLIPLGLLIPFALVGLSSILAANWASAQNGLVFALLNILTVIVALLTLPLILLRVGLFLLGWALAWGLFALWERKRADGASG